jgi:F-type H+-transporting ATPase subunit alpha
MKKPFNTFSETQPMPGQIQEVGYVTRAQDYLMHLEGLPSAKVNDIIIGDQGSIAYVTAIWPDSIEAQILEGVRPRPGDRFTIRPTGLTLPTHVSLFGRIINPIGKAVDGETPFPPGGELIDLDTVAPGIHQREHVREQFYTGIILIDTLIPVGKGQRELIFGDARSGKDLYLIDVILNQKDRDIICVYCSIGKSEIEVRRLQDKIRKAGADTYTVILAATSMEAAPMVAIAPLVACSLAEHYAKKGKTVLIIQDDLGTHAKYLREINLLAGRVPGRESYPAGIFYEHSQMVERAGNFLPEYGGGNITMLPVVETDLENMTNLIPTNVMSMTDGHTLFLSSLHAEGKYPAADVAKSVTRVGKQTQMMIHKVLADKSMALLTEYAELERFSRFGSDLAEETKRTLKRGRVMQELISQPMGVFIEASHQILFLGLVFAGYFDDKDIAFVHQKKMDILDFIKKSSSFISLAAKVKDLKFPDLIKTLEELKQEIETAIVYTPLQEGESRKESSSSGVKAQSSDQSTAGAASKVKEAMEKNQEQNSNANNLNANPPAQISANEKQKKSGIFGMFGKK